MSENDIKIPEIEKNTAETDMVEDALGITGVDAVHEVSEIDAMTAPAAETEGEAAAPESEADALSSASGVDMASDGEDTEELEIEEEAARSADGAAAQTPRAIRTRAMRNDTRRANRASAVTKNMVIHRVMAETQRPMQNRDVFHGKVITARAAEGNIPSHVTVEIGATDLTAIIPFSEFFPTDPLASEGEMPARVRSAREMRLLRNSIGAVVPFVILQANSDGNNFAGVASRNVALMRTQAVNYFGRGRNANRNIIQGRMYDADIVAVDGGGHTLWVDLGGAECRLFPGQITHRPLLSSDALRQMGYAPGSKIRVYVEALELDAENRVVTSIRLNAATAEAARLNSNLHRAQPGSEAMGTIVSYTPLNDGHYRCTVWLDDLRLPARVVSFPRFTPDYIGSGSQVACSILSIDENDSVAVRVRITRFYGASSGMFR
jgi:hypothetical protein